MTVRITVEHLSRVFAFLGAEQRQLFQRTFPEGMPLTEEAMAAAAEAGLDVFVFDDLLTGERLSAYVAARQQAAEISHAATQPTWEAFKQAPLFGRVAEQEALDAFLSAKQQADEASTAATLFALVSALREEMARSR